MTNIDDETNPARMTQRLLNAVAKLIGAMERKMDTEGVQTGEDDKTLNALSRTMDVLLGLLRKVEAANMVEAPDGDQLRAELMTRLAAWNVARGKDADGFSGEAA